MSSKYRIHNSQEIYFITFAVVEWVDALSRPYYKDLLIESLKYCQDNKGLILYAYVIMNNHVHLIASADEGYNLSDILRDMKKFSSKKLVKAIEENIQEAASAGCFGYSGRTVSGTAITKKYSFGSRIIIPSV